MYLFTRSRPIVPSHYDEAKALSIEIGDAVAQITGLDVVVAEQFSGPRAGEIGWHVVLPDFASHEDMGAKLAADPAFTTLVAKGRSWFGSSQDNAVNMLASSATADDNRMYLGTSATPLPGKIGAAIEYGLEFQAHITAAGFQSIFGTSVFGTFGEVGWLLLLRNAAEMDAFAQWQATDTSGQELLARSGAIFVPSSGQNGLSRRIN